MANRELGEVNVTISGREFTLRPSFEAIAELEDRLDMGIFKVARHLGASDVRAKFIVAALWAGIKGHGTPPLTYEQFGTLCMKEGAEGLAKLAAPAMQLVAGMFSGKEQKKSQADEQPPQQ